MLPPDVRRIDAIIMAYYLALGADDRRAAAHIERLADEDADLATAVSELRCGIVEMACEGEWAWEE